MPLTGYEETSVVEVGAVLDDTPADAEEVYLRTMNYSERAIAAVAAKRAASGSQPSAADGVTSIAAVSGFLLPQGSLAEPSPGVAAISHLLQSATISLSAADILSLGDTPVVVVPAPDPGTMLVPMQAVLLNRPGGTPFATHTNPGVGWPAYVNVLQLNLSVGMYLVGGPTDTENIVAVDGEPLVIGSLAGNPTDGDGTASLTVFYATAAVPA